MDGNQINFKYSSDGGAAILSEQEKIARQLRELESLADDINRAFGQIKPAKFEIDDRGIMRSLSGIETRSRKAKDGIQAIGTAAQRAGRSGDFKNLDRGIEGTAKTAQKAVSQIDRLGASVATMTGNLASSAIISGVNAVKGAIGDSIGVFADYEQAIRDFESVGGDKNLGNIEALKDKIKELGANTQKSAGEIASLTPSLRTAGLSADDAAASLRGLVNLSIVDKSGASIDELTEKSIDLGNAFNSIGDEEKFTKTLDTFVAAASKTNATFGGLANTVSKARGAIANANVDEASFAGIAAIFAEGGQRDEVAGTAINGMINDLNISLGVLTGAVEAPNRAIERQAEVLEELGLSGTRAAELLAKGQWDEIYLEIAGLFQNIEDSSERSAKSQLAFGKTIGKTITASFGVARDKMDEIVEGARSADDNLGKAARKMSQTLKGSFKELGSVSEAIGLNLVEGVAPSLEKLTRLTTEALRFVNGELSSAEAGAFFDGFNEGIDEALAILFEFGDRVGGDFARIVAIAKEVGGSIRADILPGLQELGATGGDAIATILELVSELFSFIRNDTPAVEIFGDTFAYGLGVANGVLRDSISLMEWLIDVVKLAGQNINNFLAGTDTDLVSQSAEELANLQRIANKKIDVEIAANPEEIKKQIADLKQLQKLVRNADVTGAENRDTSKALEKQIGDRLKALREVEGATQEVLQSLGKGGEGGEATVKVKPDMEDAEAEIKEAIANAPEGTLKITADTQRAEEAIAEVPDSTPDTTLEVNADTAPAKKAIAQLSSRDKKKAEEAIALREAQAIAAIKQQAAAGELADREAMESAISKAKETAIQERLGLVEEGSKEEAKLLSALADIQISRGETAEKSAETKAKAAEDAAEKAQEAAKKARDAAIEAIEKQQIEGEIEIAEFKLENRTADPEVIALKEVETARKTLQKKLELEEVGSKEYLTIRKQLIDNEIKAQDTLIALAQRRIDEEINAQNRLLQTRSQQSQKVINSQQRQAELMTIAEGAMARQNDLLSAQQQLQDAIAAVETARLDRAVESAQRGEDAIRQLAKLKKAEEARKNESKEESESEKLKREEKEKEAAIKKEKAQRKALEKELEVLGLDRNATIEEAVLARQAAEDARAEQAIANFAGEQEAARQSLSLENQREASAIRRAALEAKINESKAVQAEIEAKIAENSARGELLKAEKQGDKEAIADAQLALSLAQQATTEAQKQIPLAARRTAEAQREIAAQQQRAQLAEQALMTSQTAEAISRVTSEQNRQLDQNRERAEIGADLRDIDVTVGLGRVSPKPSQDTDPFNTANTFDTEQLQDAIAQQDPVKIPAELELSDQQAIVNSVNLSSQNELIELLKQQIELLRERAVLEASETAEKLRASQDEQQAIAESEGQGIAEKQARLEELSRPQLVGSFEEYEARKKEKAALEEEIEQAEARKAEAEKESDRLGNAIANTDEILERSRERLEIARSQSAELEKQAGLTQRIAQNQPEPPRAINLPQYFRGGDPPVGSPFSAAETGPEIASFPGSDRPPLLLQSPGVFQTDIPTHIYNPAQTQQALANWKHYDFTPPPLPPAIVEAARSPVTHNHYDSGLQDEVRNLVQELRSQRSQPSKTDITNRNTYYLTKPDQTEQARIFSAGEEQGRRNAQQEREAKVRQIRRNGGIGRS